MYGPTNGFTVISFFWFVALFVSEKPFGTPPLCEYSNQTGNLFSVFVSRLWHFLPQEMWLGHLPDWIKNFSRWPLNYSSSTSFILPFFQGAQARFPILSSATLWGPLGLGCEAWVQICTHLWCSLDNFGLFTLFQPNLFCRLVVRKLWERENCVHCLDLLGCGAGI